MPEAKVYILTRPLEKGAFVGYLGDGGKHWALIVEFLDGSGVYLCEITSDENEVIDTIKVSKYISVSASGYPHRRCEKFVDVEDCREGNSQAKIKYQGRCKTTVEFLKYHTKNIDKDEEYHLLHKNCQKFVERLIILLEVSENGRKKTKFLPNATSLLSGIAGVFLISLAVVGVVIVAIIKR